MKISLWFVVCSLLIIPVAAQPISWYAAERATIQLNVTSTINIAQKGPNPYVEQLIADVIFVPKNTETSAIRSFNTKPEATVTNDRARYTWKNPTLQSHTFSYRAIIENLNLAPRIKATIPYPVAFPQEVQQYTRPTQHIDSASAKIIGQARYLAQGQNELYELVNTIAFWTKNNVNYNLSTLTAEVSQQASWVLENKKGVCDEITTLFIALLRALGIPARFVSGIAYTTSPQFPQGWGAHGWAEVYFPGKGWVPFDPTFGEYGWVDPGHVPLKTSNDPREPTTVYEWKARDVDITVNDLTLSAQLLESRGTIQNELTLKATPLRPRTGFGSANGIMLEATNNADYSVAREFTLARVADMTIMDGESKQLVIPPKTTRKAFWTVNVRKDLNPEYQYEIPIQIYTITNQTVKTSFHTGKWDIVFSQADIQNSIEQLGTAEKEPIQLFCTLEQTTTWTGQTQAMCTMVNNGETTPATICVDTCRDIQLSHGNNPFSSQLSRPNPGQHEITITLTANVTKKSILTLTTLDTPNAAIKNIKHPESVAYGEIFPLTFTTSRQSITAPENLTISLQVPGANAELSLGTLAADQDVTITVNTQQLWNSQPTLTITASYQDPRGKTYGNKETTTVEIVNMPWWRKMLGVFVGLF
ncbi:transglutaminase domain-containing protein [Candidatus Woesearchaeota archaeon]|nr:transglutaminase domain-containing protein [Candidatus Woesearchaeota archaeon]